MKRYQHPRKLWTFRSYGSLGWTTQPPGEFATDVQEYRLVARDKPEAKGSKWLEPWCQGCEDHSETKRMLLSDRDEWLSCISDKYRKPECGARSVRYDPVEAI